MANESNFQTNYEKWCELDKILHPDQSVDELKLRLYHKHKVLLTEIERTRYKCTMGKCTRIDELKNCSEKLITISKELSELKKYVKNNIGELEDSDKIIGKIKMIELTTGSYYNTPEQIEELREELDKEWKKQEFSRNLAATYANIDKDYNVILPFLKSDDLVGEMDSKNEKYFSLDNMKRKYDAAFSTKSIEEQTQSLIDDGELDTLPLTPDISFPNEEFDCTYNYETFKQLVKLREYVKSSEAKRRRISDKQ